MNSISEYCHTALMHTWEGFKAACTLGVVLLICIFVICAIILPFTYPSIWTIAFGGIVVCFILGWGKSKVPPSFG